MTTTTPRIYVACLASYNAGKLHGVWIDCDQDADSIRDEIDQMLRESPCPNVMVDCPNCEVKRRGFAIASGSSEVGHVDCDTCNGSGKVQSAEEWAIHDYEGFGSLKLGENESIESIANYAAILGELDDSEAEAFQAWLDNRGSSNYDIDDSSLDEFREQYQGCYDSLADYAEQWCEDTGSIPRDLPTWLSSNIDWHGVGREFEMGGDIWTHQGDNGLHVFYNH